MKIIEFLKVSEFEIFPSEIQIFSKTLFISGCGSRSRTTPRSPPLSIPCGATGISGGAEKAPSKRELSARRLTKGASLMIHDTDFLPERQRN